MYTISSAQPNNVVEITRLAYETLPEQYTPSLFIQLYELFPEGFLVAKIGQEIIGFLISIKTHSTQARILMLGIRQQYRRKGIASALIRKFLVTASIQNISIIELEVRTTNKDAISFYQKLGFTIKDIIKGFYQDGADAYCMRLWLQTY